jgi:hypothetical protein
LSKWGKEFGIIFAPSLRDQPKEPGIMKRFARINGRIDHRYEVCKVFCGYEKPQYVLYFCGEWLQIVVTLADAILAIQDHRKHMSPETFASTL